MAGIQLAFMIFGYKISLLPTFQERTWKISNLSCAKN